MCLSSTRYLRERLLLSRIMTDVPVTTSTIGTPCVGMTCASQHGVNPELHVHIGILHKVGTASLYNIPSFLPTTIIAPYVAIRVPRSRVSW